MKSITEISQSYQDGSLNPVGVTQDCLNTIAEKDDTYGAFQTVYSDQAKLAAESAAERLASGNAIGRFDGIPFALKDNIDIEGLITTGGAVEYRHRISPTTASVAQRLLDAGGILVGKTKLVELAFGGWGTNQCVGTPRNPHDMKTHRCPGGSSSGSAVAVSAGLVPCAVGTDTGGSVRGPAAWCGIVGLKTTQGLLSNDGVIPLSHTLDTIGPMTQTIDDAALMLDVMCGNKNSGIRSTASVAGMRLAILTDDERETVESGILELYDQACEQARQQGAVCEPLHTDLSFDEMNLLNGHITACEAWYHHGELYSNPDATVDPDIKKRMLVGKGRSASEYISALQEREKHRTLFARAFAPYDLLLTPTLPMAAPAIDQVDQSTTPAQFTRAVNYLSLCGISVPIGMTVEHLPGGLQIVARGGEEEAVLKVGKFFEQYN
ncbi:MAG: aspartyl-tRNA(Asn)/glutamyl-tRNA(Gln) amidotransferase subunit A [Parasphingorhabdus sp.]|jgi:aspartyl-tRNA(Asn)/glutamyl-tRNA(Gln) amidotransferase subunit A